MTKSAVYAGTFDPITNGHYDIIQRATRIFDQLYVAVVKEPNKKTLFSPQDRVELVKQSLAEKNPEISKNVIVESFDGLLVNYVKARKCRVVIRGLRAVTDYEYEAQMAIINRHLAEEIETVFLMTSDQCSFISASIVRDIAKLSGDVSGLVPRAVSEKLIKSFKKP